MIPLFKVHMAEVAPELTAVLDSGYIGQGPKVEEFEGLLRGFFENNFCNTTNSATSALHLALHMCKDGQRTEVLSTPLTCTATNFAIRANGLDIRWIDVDPMTCNICTDSLKEKLGPNTLAVMVVHWGGYPCDLDEINKILDGHERLYGYRPHVIEDSAHAFGSRYKGKLIGSHGNFCCFSFQAIKHLTTGDGGLLISPTHELHRRGKLLRWYGLDRESSADMRCEQNVAEWGYKFHMNDINATIGIGNFKHIEKIVDAHKRNGKRLYENLQNVPGVTLLENSPDCDSAYWIFTMRVKDRDSFTKHMEDSGIACSRVHDRNDKHECLKRYKENLPGTSEVCGDMICIPCGWWISEEDCDYMVEKIKQGW